MNKILETANKTLSVLRTNPYLSGSTTLFLVLYAGLAAPALPANIAGLFEHNVFKLAILVLVLLLVKGQNIRVALLVAVGFVVSLGTLSRYRAFSMANDLQLGVKVAEPKDADEVTWHSKDGVNSVSIRGHEYQGTDHPNHLPGGHGDMSENEMPMTSDPHGYPGPDFANLDGQL